MTQIQNENALATDSNKQIVKEPLKTPSWSGSSGSGSCQDKSLLIAAVALIFSLAVPPIQEIIGQQSEKRAQNQDGNLIGRLRIGECPNKVELDEALKKIPHWRAEHGLREPYKKCYGIHV